MNKALFVIIGLILPFVSCAQEYEFEYRPTKSVVYMEGDKITYGYDKQTVITKNAETRSVLSEDAAYLLVTQKAEYGTLIKVLNDKDSLLATAFLSGEKANNLLLPDGRILQYKKVSNRTWSYLDNGKEIVTYTPIQKDGRKRVLIKYNDPSFDLAAIQLLCLDHGRTKLKANPAIGLFVVGGVAAIIGVIASREEEKSTLP